MIIVGVMSGSSLDGLDMAAVQFSDHSTYQLLAGYTAELDTDIVARLRACTKLSALEYLQLDRDYAAIIGEHVQRFLSDHHITADAIGLHGHTVVHEPDHGLTTQLASGGVLCSVTGTDVITDFRIQDVTKGGIGTPLVSIMDHKLLSGYDHYLNLGGIANISHTTDGKVSAYDVCPCNQLLNYIAQQQANVPYDDGGNIARKGNIIPALIDDIDQLNYWTAPTPKSLDNNWIKENILAALPMNDSAEDLLHTVTLWIARKIAATLPHTAEKVLVTGGGAYNLHLIEQLQQMAGKNGHEIIVAEPQLIDYKEAILMAYLAYLRLTDQPNVLQAVTNASSDTIAGAHYKANR